MRQGGGGKSYGDEGGGRWHESGSQRFEAEGRQAGGGRGGQGDAFKSVKGYIHESYSKSRTKHGGERVDKFGERRKEGKKEAWKPPNPFRGNVGAARQLRALGLDTEDPAVSSQDWQGQVDDMEQGLEERMEQSKQFRKKWKADEENQRRLSKNKIIEKNMFPKPANPSLLTWLEKEMIR